MKNIIITGANRGIGFELTKQLSCAGYHVLAAVRKPLQAVELIELAASEEHDISIFKVDVTNKLSVDNFAKTIVDTPIEILINNAAILDTYDSSIDNIDLVSFAEVLTTNVINPVRIMRAAMPSLRLGVTKKIVNISSTMGSFNRLSTGAHAYCASKAALNKVMQVFGQEHEDEGFVIMNLHPGWVKTKMGGVDAEIDVQTSIKGLINIIEITDKNVQHMIGYDGEKIPY